MFLIYSHSLIHFTTFEEMRKRKPFLFISILVLMISACSKDDSEDLPENFAGYNYLPLSVGLENIYLVDSIAYDDFTGTVDTTQYFIRELFEGTVQDLGVSS